MDRTFTPMASQESILMGFHYMDYSNLDRIRDTNDYPLNIYPYFEDYLTYMESDMRTANYADFWRWWYILERYKGDELGLSELDSVVDRCLERGIKVKIDPAWNTWWSLDVDWETHENMAIGPQDIDDWIHFCELVARRYRGRICLWDLQGEANSLDQYWINKPWAHVHEVYRKGYEVFKSLDGNVRIGISGASPSVPLEDMNNWYWGNLKACAGLYDNVPMNYFAHLADPYNGALNYYQSIQSMLDRLGLKHVEIGMGETSVQWAESTVKAATDNLNMRIQTEALNEMYGSLFNEGMNKNIMWFTEYAPGGGHWPWRWGLRNYEDWWGIWPADKKIDGTRIVYRYDAPDGTVFDMRPEWPEPSNPYYPGWEIHKFWQQAAPNAQESMRVRMSCSEEKAWKLCAWHKTLDTFTALACLYDGACTDVDITVDVSDSAWQDGETAVASVSVRTFDMDCGKWKELTERECTAIVEKGRVNLTVENTQGFITIRLRRSSPALLCEFISIVAPEKLESGSAAICYAIVKNTGSAWWKAGDVKLCAGSTQDHADQGCVLPDNVAPGNAVMIAFRIQAELLPGVQSIPLRMHARNRFFGPEAYAHIKIIDSLVPRKLVTHALTNGVFVQWFSPTGVGTPNSYTLYRAEGYGSSFEKLTETSQLSYLDSSVLPGQAYYYKVQAKYGDGKTSAFSITDNAKTRCLPRYYDAEIIRFDAPSILSMGETGKIQLSFRNTGTKTWKLNDRVTSFSLATTKYFDSMEESKLPVYTVLGDREKILPGETVDLEFPICAPSAGMFENHWILRMDVRIDPVSNRGINTRPVYFGTPFLHEIKVNL